MLGLRLSHGFARWPPCTVTRTPPLSRRRLRVSCSRLSVCPQTLLVAASDLIMLLLIASFASRMGSIAASQCRQPPRSQRMGPTLLLFSVRRCGSPTPRPPSPPSGGGRSSSTGRSLTGPWSSLLFWMVLADPSPPSSVSLARITPAYSVQRRRRLRRRLLPTRSVASFSLRTLLTEGVSLKLGLISLRM